MNTKNICPECGKAVTQEGLQGLCPECMIKVGVAPQTAEFGPEGTQLVQPSSAPVPSAEELGRLLPQFEILECLGRGGMGVVYKARQPKLDRFVAWVELMNRDMLAAGEALAARELRAPPGLGPGRLRGRLGALPDARGREHRCAVAGGAGAHDHGGRGLALRSRPQR